MKIMKLDDFVLRYSKFIVDPCGWMIDETGVWRNGNDKTIFACYNPIFPTCLYENTDTGVTKVELHFLTNGQDKKLIVNRSVIANKNNIIRLADDGVDVDSDTAGKLMQYLSALLAKNREFIPYRKSKSVMGWCGEEFVPYSKVICCDNDEQFKNIQNCLKAKGDKAEWIRFTKELRKNLYLRLIMAASFASPIIERVGENPFVLMLWGGTGSGKTVAMEVAMSVWGNPNMGNMTRTMNMTINSTMVTASFLRNLPFGGDELQTIKSKYDGSYDSLIMQITEGVDRGRLNSNSQLREMKNWKCSFIFTGEEPVTKAASGGGVKNRVIEIECTDTIIPNGNEVCNFIWENYGLVAEDFIDAVRNTDVRSMYKQTYTDIMTTFNTTNKQAGAMALMLVADRIASKTLYGFEDPLLLANIQPFLCAADDVDVAERAYQYTCGLISEHANNFNREDDDKYGPVWGERTDECVFINAKVLNEQLQSAGFDFDACKRRWVAKGYMEKAKNLFTIQRRISGIVTRCYKLFVQKEDAKQ